MGILRRIPPFSCSSEGSASDIWEFLLRLQRQVTKTTACRVGCILGSTQLKTSFESCGRRVLPGRGVWIENVQVIVEAARFWRSSLIVKTEKNWSQAYSRCLHNA